MNRFLMPAVRPNSASMIRKPCTMPNRLSALLPTWLLAVAMSLALGGTAPARAQGGSPSGSVVAPPTAAGEVASGVVATTTRETVDNPYGLGALWAQGDFVSRGTLIILVLMSMGSWYILVTKLYESLKINRESKAAHKTFFRSANLGSALQTLQEGGAYHYGVTPQTTAALRLTAGNHVALDFSAHAFLVSDVGGYATAAGDVILRGDASLGFRLFRRNAVSLRYLFNQRDTSLVAGGTFRQSRQTVGVFYTLLGPHGFGATRWSR